MDHLKKCLHFGILKVPKKNLAKILDFSSTFQDFIAIFHAINNMYEMEIFH